MTSSDSSHVPSRLRVLIVANSFDPTERFAGGFVHLVQVVQRWQDVDVTLLAPAAAKAIFAAAFPRARFVAAPDLGRLPRAPQWLLRGLFSMPVARRLRRSNDVLLALAPFLPDMLPALAFGLKRSAVYLWHFIGNPFMRAGSRLRNVLAWINECTGTALALRSRAFIVGTRLVADACGIGARSNVFVTTNGVDHLHVAAPRAERFGVMYVGRLHPSKNVEDLLVAWAALTPEVRREGLRIVGRGTPSYVDHLRRRIAALGLGNAVTIVEDADDERKAALLAQARLFAFPSREEGWCIALAEAMQAGLPCVTYDLPVFREVFPRGRIGVEPGDAMAFAGALEGLLEDAQRAARLGRDASESATQFTWTRAATIEREALAYVANGGA